MTRYAAVLMLLAAPGCIVQDIHDEIATSNRNLETINESMAQIEQANETLAAVNVNLERIDAKLTTIDSRLASMERRMELVQTVLAEIGEHMTSFRETINNIDALIPLIDVSGDDAADRADLREGQPAPADNGPKGDPPT